MSSLLKEPPGDTYWNKEIGMALNPSLLPHDGTKALFSLTLTVVNASPTAVRAIVSGADKVAVRKRVRALAEMLSTQAIPGVRGMVPTNESLTVEFDPTLIGAMVLKRVVRLVDASAGRTAEG